MIRFALAVESESHAQRRGPARLRCAHALSETGRGFEGADGEGCLRDIIQLLKAERQRLGLSLSEIGERSGIGKANLSRLENDQDPNPTMDTLLRYADALGRAIHITLSEPDPPNRRRASG